MNEVLSLKSIVGGGYGDYWRCQKRYRVCKGSRGSKKSKTTALWLIVNMMQHSQANTLVVRRTFATLKDSCYSDLRWAIDRLKVNAFWRCTTNPLEITYLPTGQRILFRGMDDPLKITSISVPVGVLCWVWIEEAYEITDEDAFNKLDMSIRGEMPDGLFKQITMTFNPWSAQSWLKARFFDVEDDDVFTKTTTYKCNEWLDDADRSIFEKMRINNPRRYRIEGLGEWGVAEGLIYDKVEFMDFSIEEIRQKAGVKAAFGLDFGFTDPTAFVACIIDESDAKIYVFDEFYERGFTNEKIADKLIAMGWGGQRVVCDSAEPKSIRELQQLGIKAEPSRKGGDSVLHGIQKLQNFTFIVSPRCPNFYHEIGNYCWQKDKFGKPVDKPEHEFSHCMDAVRYAVTKQLVGNLFSFD